MKKQKFKLRHSGLNIPASGGYRVEEFGLIEVLEDCVVIWGIHNNRIWEDKVSKGYVFNSLDIVGDWHDIVPIYKKDDGVYFKRVGDSIAATELDVRNKKNKISVKRIYTKPENSDWY